MAEHDRGSRRRSQPAKRTSRRSADANSGRARGDAKRKRTSRNSDDRNPTRSGIDYPSPKFRRKGEEEAPTGPAPKSALRKVERSRAQEPTRRTRTTKPRPAPAKRRRRVKTTEASEELARLAGRNARRAQDQLARAAEAFAAGRERDAMRMLRPLRDAYPDASAVRELLGLCHYRIGQYAAATKELDAFVALTDSVEQHPVLMDCARATGKYHRVEELWEELATASPSSALVTEGRIVLAGARADRGRLREAIATLDRRSGDVKRVQDHHLRLWYALADLYERAGEIPKARTLFLKVRKHDAGFADVAERLAALG
jgi:tetratricopeptide (TPR) repeat protein